MTTVTVKTRKHQTAKTKAKNIKKFSVCFQNEAQARGWAALWSNQPSIVKVKVSK